MSNQFTEEEEYGGTAAGFIGFLIGVILLVLIISFVAIDAYVYFSTKIDSRECRENLTPGYECVKTYIQVPKGE